MLTFGNGEDSRSRPARGRYCRVQIRCGYAEGARCVHAHTQSITHSLSLTHTSTCPPTHSPTLSHTHMTPTHPPSLSLSHTHTRHPLTHPLSHTHTLDTLATARSSNSALLVAECVLLLHTYLYTHRQTGGSSKQQQCVAGSELRPAIRAHELISRSCTGAPPKGVRVVYVHICMCVCMCVYIARMNSYVASLKGVPSISTYVSVKLYSCICITRARTNACTN